MRAVAGIVVALAACAPRPLVLQWAAARSTVTERLEIRSNGEVHYRTLTDGEPPTDARVDLSPAQLHELSDMARARRACALPHDAAYAPVAGEATITLTLDLPDLRCTITLWEHEWREGPAADLATSLASIRPGPTRPAAPSPDRLGPGRR